MIIYDEICIDSGMFSPLLTIIFFHFALLEVGNSLAVFKSFGILEGHGPQTISNS
jgi:hypothetical protein